MQTKISLNTVNRVRINMNLKYEKRGTSPGTFLSILSNMEDSHGHINDSHVQY